MTDVVELRPLVAAGTALSPIGEGDEPPRTDTGNAERFVMDHHYGTRFVHTWGKWLLWDTKRWAVDATGMIVRLAEETIRGLYHRAYEMDDKNEREQLAKWALRSEAEPKLRAMLKLAACDVAIAIEATALDTKPNYFNVLNGTINLQNGELLPHFSQDLITKLAPMEYCKTAKCPRFLAFLEEILPDPAVRTFVQRAVGYSLTAMTSERCLFILYGSGANGKSTFLEVIRLLLGDYARQADVSTFMRSRSDTGPRPEVVRLVGARFVSSVEVEEGRRLAESLLKALTGNDMIAARGLYADVIEFLPTFKVWLGTNPQAGDPRDGQRHLGPNPAHSLHRHHSARAAGSRPRALAGRRTPGHPHLGRRGLPGMAAGGAERPGRRSAGNRVLPGGDGRRAAVPGRTVPGIAGGNRWEHRSLHRLQGVGTERW